MHVNSRPRPDQQQERAPTPRQGPCREDHTVASPPVAALVPTTTSGGASSGTVTPEGAAEIVAIRQRHDRTHLIVTAGESRYHVTVAVARDHSTGRAIGFRHWIRSERVAPREQESIDAALRDIMLLERTHALRDETALPVDSETIGSATVQMEVIEERRQPGARW